MNLYVVGSSRGPKKIGIAANPALRLRALRTGNSRAISLLFSAPAPEGLATNIERRAHWLLRDKKTNGEWFDVSAKAAIDAVQRAIDEGGAGEKEPPSVGRPPLKRNVATVMLSVRLPADVIERIDARVGDMTRGEWVRDAIERRLKASPPIPRGPEQK
jgi:hypothetical protein